MSSQSLRAALTVATLLTLTGFQAHAQTAPAAPASPVAPAPLAIKAVKPGLFMVTGGGGNVSVRVTPAGLIVVDDKLGGQGYYDDLMGRIRSVSDAPVVWVINTHHHGDHVGNNARFLAAGAKVIGHSNLALELDKFTPPANNPTAVAPAKPSVTYQDRYVVSLGGKTTQLLHFTPAHTRGDTIVYFPDLMTVAMGDEFVATTPTFDYAGGASLVGWMNSIDQVLKLDWDTAIPGHGDNALTRADLIAFRGKLATFFDRAKAQVQAGVSKDKLVASIKTDDLWTFSPTYWSAARVDGLYAEAGGR